VEPGVHPGFGRALEEARGAPKPSCADRWRLAAEEHVSEKKGRAGGVGWSTGLHVDGERPLESFGRLIGLARPPGGLAHLLEVVGRQGTFAVGRGECFQRLCPGVPFDGVSA
jgi:hypothetical protein